MWHGRYFLKKLMRTCDSNMKLLSKIFWVAALLYFSSVSLGDELTGRKLTIEVTNGTTNGSAVAGDEINVSIYHHKQLIETLTTLLTLPRGNE